ncbi:MAG: DUF2442 domain-containing protein [Fusobacteriaceae bacterium]|jgi:hypothetical protein|nr:DUF2442 domain-containing protein [Fusobacteriaceae bacterium]
MLQPKILSASPLDQFRLYLVYENGENRIFDVSPYISGEWFGRLADRQYFKTAHLNGVTVEWADGQDIAPHELYELSKLVEVKATT